MLGISTSRARELSLARVGRGAGAALAATLPGQDGVVAMHPQPVTQEYRNKGRTLPVAMSSHLKRSRPLTSLCYVLESITQLMPQIHEHMSQHVHGRTHPDATTAAPTMVTVTTIPVSQEPHWYHVPLAALKHHLSQSSAHRSWYVVLCDIKYVKGAHALTLPSQLALSCRSCILTRIHKLHSR